MKTSILTFSPNGDTELILRRPNFRKYNEPQNESKADEAVSKNEVVKLDDNKTEDSQPTEDGIPVTDVFSDKSSSIHTTEDLKALKDTNEAGHSTQICLLVSSTHLTLSSPVFKAMLDGSFSESKRNEDNLFELKTFEWNAEALVILLDIIHGHHRSLPKTVTLDTLIEVAMLCDYYQCEEIVEVFADRWITALSEDKPYEEQATMDWMFIAWVFQKDMLFTAKVAATLQHSRIPVQTDLTLPSMITGTFSMNLSIYSKGTDGIAEKLEAQRLKLLNEVLDNLYGLHESLWVTNDNCNRECASMLLGSLMKQMREAGLMPRPKELLPSTVRSVRGLRGFVSGLETPVWYIGRPYGGLIKHECSFKNKTQPWMDYMGRTYLDGFRFQDFTGASNNKGASASK
ncbi:hypothetical protein NW768_001006 [Fusarium equiseti]|uniref:BTB domain-containing protein n=1 Tax=Fusarium equiseti TaxID=61235 RepID=A0ABQ8RUH7_FUSEQ|nr:hypothetical protein NW768_001006 [Fusarium equiseti]